MVDRASKPVTTHSCDSHAYINSYMDYLDIKHTRELHTCLTYLQKSSKVLLIKIWPGEGVNSTFMGEIIRV